MDRVEIKEPNTGKTIIFPCNKWLSKDKEDGEIARDLYPVISSENERGSRDSSRTSPRPNSRRPPNYDQYENGPRRMDRDLDRDVDRFGGGSRNSFRGSDNNKKEREFSFENNIKNRSDRDILNRERDRDNFRMGHTRYD